ncbi:hypothetical protein KL930_004886 [Ogataea haglerorum]|uniref:Alpha-1,2-mannosyltransferase n=1 Tax=Ogataea haglerorum TaxID=1937702 RepID=A0AAN6D890_9ASCO|nr:uncharacterized protein KL911_004993 [Ogataea haglerorum]KAG7692253.1 hypothetical protein KL915_004684 [Ogataea haglerorum]KAG7699777.1 hypothetical protein KL951_001494 [Ogataea haglerorum]KAG7703177.1 hypothetical protein KL950_004811 [Ogataea haglerorum]KAG7726603.1 hypothetical protein KL948_004585 [Ogataea haglerorum]KAG7729794.1 hypothetical protein KL933_000874 [Ogataea haglerorum]
MQISAIRPHRRYIVLLLTVVLCVLLYSAATYTPRVDENARIRKILNDANPASEVDPDTILQRLQNGPPSASASPLSVTSAPSTREHVKNKPKNKKPKVSLEEFEESRARVINAIFKLIASVRPAVSYTDRRSNRGDDSPLSHSVLTEDLLSQFLQFSPEFVDAFKSSHADIVEKIYGIKFPQGLYKGNGVVMIGGDDYSWLTLVSIKVMRDSGGDLPVEVIMPRRLESDSLFCNKYLPELNAKCVYLTDLLGENYESEININKYQYKGVALLASSFENLLLLDSDNMPVVPITDQLFNSTPFSEYGMVFWPDFWKRTTSPVFYEIAATEVLPVRVRDCQVDYPKSQYSTLRPKDARTQIPYHDRLGAIPDKSTESGQLLISKREHADVVLLSLYYNAYGPDGYYALLSQGVAGEGDKDTFPAAATVLEKNFYQLKKNVGVNGFMRNGEYRGVGMLQYDPINDYENYREFVRLHESSDEMFEAQNMDDFLGPEEKNKVMFAHCNFPKLYPDELLEDFVIRNHEHIKMLESSQIPGNYEYHFWQIMYDLICVDRVDLTYTRNKKQMSTTEERAKFCDGPFKEHVEWLKTR